MRSKILAFVGIGAAAAALATPAFAWDGGYGGWDDGWFDRAPPSYYRQNPDGTYPSISDLSQAVQGTPCDAECAHDAAVRWGFVPPHRRHHYDSYEDRE